MDVYLWLVSWGCVLIVASSPLPEQPEQPHELMFAWKGMEVYLWVVFWGCVQADGCILSSA